MSDVSTNLRPSPQAALAEVDDGAVILHMGTKRYFSLNGTGAHAWRMIESGSTRDEIVASFVESFEVGADDAAAALDSLLAELVEEELLERVTVP